MQNDILIKQYDNVEADLAALAEKIASMNKQFASLEKMRAVLRKEIRDRTQSTYRIGQSTAVMNFNGRKVHARIGARRDSVYLKENGKEIGWFGSIWEAEFALGSGQI